MPWTQGEFNVPNNFVAQYNAGQKKIRADLMDENFNDVAGAINKVVTDYKDADTAIESSVMASVQSVLPVAATTAPAAPGTAAVGTSTKYAREDHVHPIQVIPEQTPMMYNTRTVLTSSGTYTAPVTGWYKVTCIGGGGGGGGGFALTSTNISFSGGGGGEGGTSTKYLYMTKGQTKTYVIGAGGNGGTSTKSIGSNGGNTSFGDIVAGGGGGGGEYSDIATSARCTCPGIGGTSQSNTPGCPGCAGYASDRDNSSFGGSGGGSGGGAGAYGGSSSNKNKSSVNGATNTGGGGGGGSVYPNYGSLNGAKGGSGVIILEYYDPNKTA